MRKPTISQPSSPHRDTLHRSVAKLLLLGEQYFLPEAVELLRRVDAQTRLTDDEILLLTVTAAQAVRAHYIEPGSNSSKEALEQILHILDHEEVIRAEYNKLHTLLRGFPHEEQDHSTDHPR